MRFLASMALVAAVLAGGVCAQGVPYGEHVVSIFQNVTSSTTGLVFADRVNNTCKPVNGLSTAAQEANAVQIDPVNDTVWLGTVSTGELYRVSIDSTCTVVSETLWGAATSTTTTAAGIQAIAFDNNGDPVVAVSGNPGGVGDGIWKFQRNTPGSATMLQAASGINALCRDPSGNLYYGVTGTGTLFMMTVQKDCSYGPPMLLGTIIPASNSGTITGVDYCAATNELWWTSLGTGGSSVGRFPLPGGPAASGATTLPTLNAIEYDTLRNDLAVVTAGPNPDSVFSVSKSFATSTICVLPPNGANGTPSGIDTSDCTTAETIVTPRCVTGGVPFTVEMATCCPPGQVGGIFILSPTLLAVKAGSVGPSGKLISPQFKNLLLPPGTPPGLLAFVSVCLNPTTTALTLGRPVLWPDDVK